GTSAPTTPSAPTAAVAPTRKYRRCELILSLSMLSARPSADFRLIVSPSLTAYSTNSVRRRSLTYRRRSQRPEDRGRAGFQPLGGGRESALRVLRALACLAQTHLLAFDGAGI